MKLKFKLIAIFVLFMGMSTYLIVSANDSINSYNKINNLYEKTYNECLTIINNKEDDRYIACNDFIEEYNKSDNSDNNFYVIFSDVIINSLNKLSIVLILIINVFSIIWVNKVLKNKYIINYYIRSKKSYFIKLLFKESYVYILPIFISFIILILYILFNTKIGLTYESLWSINTISNFTIFIILYLVHLLLFFLSYTNIGLIVSRKNYNYILSLIATYLLFIIMQLFNELIIEKILKFKYSIYLSIGNCFVFDDTLGLLSPLIFPLVLFIITFIIILKIYNNKEKIYLDCECR